MTTGPIPPYKPRPQLPTEYVALGIVRKDGRILVSRRRKDIFLGGFWEFPGGKREPGESYAACVARELKEEVDLDVRVVRELTPVRHDYGSRRVILQPYLCEVASGEARPVEVSEVKWVSPSELETLGMPEANAPIIRQILDGNRAEAPV